MHGYRSVVAVEYQAGHEVVVYEFGRLMYGEALDVLAHAVHAGALITYDWELAALRRFVEGFFEFGSLGIGNIWHAFALPDHATAQTAHILGEYYLISCLAAQTYEYFGKWPHFGVRFLALAHGAVDALGEVYEFTGLRRTDCLYDLPWVEWRGQRWRPEWEACLVHDFAY